MALFPLPVAPFEHYMLADDRADYPMTFFLRLHFRGIFKREQLHAALRAALDWHPLLRAQIQGNVDDTTSRLFWIDASPRSPMAIWQSGSTPPDFTNGSQIDLTRETGLRLWLQEDGESTEILAQFHHACCDGLGALQFFETLFELYDSPSDVQPPPEWEARHAMRLQVCGAGNRSNWKEHLLGVGKGLARICRYLRTKPEPLELPRELPQSHRIKSPSPELAVPNLVSHHFDDSDTAQIRAAAKRLHVSTNTLLIRDLFLALHEWNCRWRAGETGGALRIVVPVNLRDQTRESLPAFNAVSLAFVDRRPVELGNPDQLLAGLDCEIDEAKCLRRGMEFLPAIKNLGKFRHGMYSRLRGDGCLGTAVFSNLGVVFAGSRLLTSGGLIHSGELILTQIEAAPPVRPRTHASFAALVYGQVLTICLCYDAYSFRLEESRTLLDLYVRRLRSSAESLLDAVALEN